MEEGIRNHASNSCSKRYIWIHFLCGKRYCVFFLVCIFSYLFRNFFFPWVLWAHSVVCEVWAITVYTPAGIFIRFRIDFRLMCASTVFALRWKMAHSRWMKPPLAVRTFTPSILLKLDLKPHDLRNLEKQITFILLPGHLHQEKRKWVSFFPVATVKWETEMPCEFSWVTEFFTIWRGVFGRRPPLEQI